MNMRLSLIVLAIGLSLSSCESRDAKLQKSLIGTWQVAKTTPDGISTEGQSTYLADGTMQAQGTLVYEGQKIEFLGSGTWKVEKGNLQWTALKSNIPNLIPVGYSASDKILSVTETAYTYLDSDTGKTETEYRVKQPKP